VVRTKLPLTVLASSVIENAALAQMRSSLPRSFVLSSRSWIMPCRPRRFFVLLVSALPYWASFWLRSESTESSPIR